MILLLLIVVGSAWAFFIALEIDRPDLIVFLPTDHQIYTHSAFVILISIAVLYVSWFELTHDRLTLRQSTVLLTRNFIVLGLGVVLLTFISRELLHGIDPTGHHQLWNVTPKAKPEPASVNPPPHGSAPVPPLRPH